MDETTSTIMVDQATNVIETSHPHPPIKDEKDGGEQQVMNSSLVHLNQIADRLTSSSNTIDACKQQLDSQGSCNGDTSQVIPNSNGQVESSTLENSDTGQAAAKEDALNISKDSVHSLVTQPDSDAVKMFVGQIPRSWQEQDIIQLFQDFGHIHSINILRDKKSGESRGCCFLTFCSKSAALEARDTFHNSRVLPGMHHPIQMKAADNESRNERKLFVGMLSKKLSENNVRQIFAPFGTIEECTVLRDATGSSKGCAFITYDTKSSAMNAIESMNHSQTMEGCSSPLVVKFADSQKEKEVKRHNRDIISRIWSSPSASMSSKVSNLSPQQLTISSNQYLTTLATIATAAAQQQQQQHQFAAVAALALQQQLAAVTDPMNLSNPLLGNFCTSPNQAQSSSTAQLYNKNQKVTGPVGAVLGQQLTALPSTSRYFTVPQTLIPTLGIAQPITTATIPKQSEGPDGANLFIYHLPVEYGDADLAQIFTPFGNVISSRVFVDKITHLSKCFGFVSFDCASSAQAAIQSMNGFQIGNKRLKVQLKRTKDKPY